MTAQTGRIDAAFGWSAIDCAKGEALPAAEVGATQNAASPAPSCAKVIPSPTRLHVPALAQPIRRPEGGRRQGPSGRVRPLGTGHAGAKAGKRPASRTTSWSYVASKGCGSAHRRLNALLSDGSLSASVKTAQTASRSSSLRTFPEAVLPSSTAPVIDTAMLAKPFCLSLGASSSTCSGARRTKERSRHRTVSKLSAPAFIRALV